ncbi:hypothetical protein, partial [Bacteroides ovatus]|uniref:hypothetical protein n=1 Tax=Bacteroides ovatus TaxID=28116 RepID=UPI00089427F2
MIAFILIVTVNLILLLVVNYYYTHVVVRNTQEYHIKQVEQGQWDALAFGSAYCRFGIDFSGTDMNGYNLGFASQFFYYTDKMLRQNARFTKRRLCQNVGTTSFIFYSSAIFSFGYAAFSSCIW